MACIIVAELSGQTTLTGISLPSVDGKLYKLSDFPKNGKPTLLIFWATWCKPCIEELENISDLWDDWTDEASFNMVTISIDDSRSSASVKSFVSGKQWPFLVLLDTNQEAKRNLNVSDVPQYYIFNSKGDLIKRHTGYLPGDEDLMFEELRAIKNEK